MGYSVGQLVIVLPNRIREEGFVGKIVKLEENLSKICAEDVYLVNRSDKTVAYYDASDLRGVGDELDNYIIDEICEDGRYLIETDDLDKWVLYVDDLYCCEDCDKVHNSLDSAEKISYVKGKIVGEPKFYEPTEEEESDMFMVGYLECLNDIRDYWSTASIDTTIVDKVLNDMKIGYISDLKDKDFSRFYSLVMKHKEEEAKKPKLTLADIKEKLGYDFELVD